MEDIIEEVISGNLSLDEGTTTVKIIAIDGEAIGQRKRLLYRRLAASSVITFEIQQTVVAGSGVDTDEEELRQEVADALTLEGAKEALETEELRADYGDFTLGAIEIDTGDGPPIIESMSPTFEPTYEPTKAPTKMPTKFPTRMPTRFPTRIPSRFPTR